MDYNKIYYQIIDRAKDRVIEGYVEKHHIVPKSMGGDNSKTNIVSLTAREHFLSHMLLCEIYPSNNKLKHALFLMAIGKQKVKEKTYVIGSRVYERLRKEYSNMMTGKKQSKETRDKKSKAMVEVWANKSEEEKIKIIRKRGEARKGIPASETQKANIRKALLGRKMPWRTKPVIQYTIDGKFVKEWESTAAITKDKRYGFVGAVTRGVQKTAYGYIWKHKID